MKQLFNPAFAPRYADIWLLTFRILASCFMIFGHGLPKWGRFTSGNEIQFADPFGIGPATSMALAIFAEIGCSVLIIIGLGTRWATIPLIVTMLIAAFYANAGEPFGKKELALVYLLLYVTLFVFGSGKYSLDNLIFNRLKK
jgi:putative oxidoreductase